MVERKQELIDFIPGSDVCDGCGEPLLTADRVVACKCSGETIYHAGPCAVAHYKVCEYVRN